MKLSTRQTTQHSSLVPPTVAASLAEHVLVGATISDVADHVDHIRDVAGIECVGIGADYDGIKHPAVGMPDVEYLPKLTEELLKRGYSDEVLIPQHTPVGW